MKRVAVVAVAVALAWPLAGCGGDPEPESTPQPSESTTPTPTDSTTPEPTWDDQFTAEQMAAYEEARDAWLEYWDFYTEITRKGVDTPGVKRGFEKYTLAPLGERSKYLDLFVRGGARMEVPPEVLWTSAVAIRKKTVDFRYCLDNSRVRITVDGNVTKQRRPYLVERNVRMRHTPQGWKEQQSLDGDGEPVKCSRTAP